VDGKHEIIATGNFRTNSIEALRMAALAGHGIALLPAVIIADDLRAGNLVHLLPQFRMAETVIQAVYPSSRLLPAKTRTFIDFLVGRLGQDRDRIARPLIVIGNAGRTQPQPPKAFNGGGGLYSTANDYVRFMQMILRRGQGPKKEQILQAKTVDMMATNQIGSLSAGKLKTARPEISSDVDFHPGIRDGWGLGFLINSKRYDGARSAGSLAWAGIWNTYFWIDPRKGVAGVIMMQFLPFADKDGVAVLGDFERAVYAAT